MSQANVPYTRLTARFARIAAVGEAGAVLGWDAAAMMPVGGGPARGDQMAVLAGIGHEMLTAPEMADDLARAEQAAPDDAWAAANLRLMRRAHTQASAVPPDLVEAQVRANTACEQAWRIARPASDFAAVAPLLTEVVRLVRVQADHLSAAIGLSPYDSLMDLYQPGAGADRVAAIFADHAHWLADALPRAEAVQVAAIPLTGPFPASGQEALCRMLAARIGLEPEHFRLDRSAHPFCGGTPTDVRITTRYDEADVMTALMGVLHECGHALYERGLPTAKARQPVGAASGMATHESQSLLMEMQACRSDAFVGYLSGALQAAFGAQPALEPANLVRLQRQVERGFIRVDADEMTYPAHVFVRFELERALIAGELGVAGLPSAWAEAMRRHLGVTPPDDRRGCLQDIHWYDGAFGYFPSYTMGAMAAAQLMTAARAALPGLDAALAEGDLSGLVGWLRAHVHSQGSRLGFDDLLTEATGRPLGATAFQAHLAARYLPPG